MENSIKIDKVLSIISEKLQGVNFVFIGSVNLYIQGLEIKPRDIDILTTADNIRKIDEIFADFRTKEIYFDESEGRNSFRSFYKIDGIGIEVLGNVNNIYRDPENLDKKSYVKFNENKLPCMSLADELDVYKKKKRIEKVGMIQKFLRVQK